MESCQSGWRPLVGLNLVSSLRALKERDWEATFEIKSIFLKMIFKKASMGSTAIRQPFFHPILDGHDLSKLPRIFSLLKVGWRWRVMVTRIHRPQYHGITFHSLGEIPIHSLNQQWNPLKGCLAGLRVHMVPRQSPWERSIHIPIIHILKDLPLRNFLQSPWTR